MLMDMSGQFEDLWRILADDRLVVRFELEQKDPKALPTEVREYSMKEWAEALEGGQSQVNRSGRAGHVALPAPNMHSDRQELDVARE